MTITINGSGTITGASTLATTVASPTLTSPNLTTPNIDSAQFATVAGTAPLYACRAWVNFNGTGTIAIRASANVTSITDNGVGDYTINLTTAMPDANYAATALLNGGSGGNVMAPYTTTAPTTSAYRLGTRRTDTFAAADTEYVNVSIFR
jgi:hypothetical protein